MRSAVERLKDFGTVLALSGFVDTEPVGHVEQPRFLNAALLLETQLGPEALLDALLRVEREGGRDRSHGIAKGPRTIDLDLLLHGDAVTETERLIVPHPEMHRRGFVLRPLAEIAPGMMHPVLRRTVRQMFEALETGVC